MGSKSDDRFELCFRGLKKLKPDDFDPMQSMGFVYVIGSKEHPEKPYKIGFSVNPDSRLKRCQTHSWYRLQVLHTFIAGSRKESERLESMFHCYLNDSRLEGEWFKSDSVRSLIAEHMQRLPSSKEVWFRQMGRVAIANIFGSSVKRGKR